MTTFCFVKTLMPGLPCIFLHVSPSATFHIHFSKHKPTQSKDRGQMPTGPPALEALLWEQPRLLKRNWNMSHFLPLVWGQKFASLLPKSTQTGWNLEGEEGVCSSCARWKMRTCKLTQRQEEGGGEKAFFTGEWMEAAGRYTAAQTPRGWCCDMLICLYVLWRQ